jgi:hypothetical protein
LRSIDGTLEALVDERLACLDVLVDCSDQLRIRFGSRHARRRPGIDEAPFPEPPPAARPLDGLGLRSVALTILRRHGPQRLRDLHGLVHLYGYRIDSARPVQRLGDAMAYEVRQGRVERLERGVYGPVPSGTGPERYVPPPQDLDGPLPWEHPVTDPGPPLLDPDVAVDPELWSRAEWPTEDDLPDDDLCDEDDGPGPAPGPPPDPDPGASDPSEPDPPDPDGLTPGQGPLSDDSPANRRSASPEQARPWEPPP